MRIYQHSEIPTSGDFIPKSRWLDGSLDSAIAFGLTTDVDGTLLFYQSSDDLGNFDSTLTFNIRANIREVHIIRITSPFCRFKFTYSGTCLKFRLDVMRGDYSILTSPNNLQLQQDADALAVRPTDYKYEAALGKRYNETITP